MPMPSSGRGAKKTLAPDNAAAKALPSADQVLRNNWPIWPGAAVGKGASWPGSGASWIAREAKGVPAVSAKTDAGGMSRRRYQRKPRRLSKSVTGATAAGSGKYWTRLCTGARRITSARRLQEKQRIFAALKDGFQVKAPPRHIASYIGTKVTLGCRPDSSAKASCSCQITIAS